MMIESEQNSIPDRTVVVAAYIDILGFKTLIDQSEENWQEATKKVLLIDQKLRAIFTAREGGIVRFFSDNVYVSVPLIKDGELYADNLFHIFREMYEMQWFFVEVGIFIRGGIAVGTQFATETTLFGTALVKAYLAESKCAIVPRIVVDDSLIDALVEHGNQMSRKAYVPNTRLLIRRDEDGVLFMDYMSLWDDWTWMDSYKTEIFLKHREIILAEIDATNDERILSKHLWLAKYHNVYGERNGASIDIKKAFGGRLPNELLEKHKLELKEIPTYN